MSHKLRVILFLALGISAIAAVIWLFLHPEVFEFTKTVQEPTQTEENQEIEVLALDVTKNTNELPPAGSGVTFFYQQTSIKDPGTETWANDDIGRTIISSHSPLAQKRLTIADLDVPPDRGGTIVSAIFGKDLLVHRYQVEGDGIFSLDGEITPIESSWNKIRSTNNIWEVEQISTYFDVPQTYRLTNLQTNVTQEFTLNTSFSDEQTPVFMPSAVSDDGTQLIFGQIHANDGWMSQTDLVLYNIPTQSIENFANLSSVKELFKGEDLEDRLFTDKIYSWYFDREQNKIIMTFSALGPATEPGMIDVIPIGPSKVYVIDVETDTSQLVLEDELFYISNAYLSPDGKSLAYGFTTNPDRIWITDIGATRENNDAIVSGRLLDWVDHYLVVARNQDLLLYDLTNTKQPITVLGRTIGQYGDPDYQSVEYIGYLSL